MIAPSLTRASAPPAFGRPTSTTATISATRAPRLACSGTRAPSRHPPAPLARVALLLALASLLAAPRARASDEVTVVIAPARTPGLEAATTRVAAELTAAGYRVSAGCAPAIDPRCDLAWPAGARAVAGVGFTWASDGVAIEARVARPDRRTVRLEALVAGVPVPEPSVVAVRATELVRAGVLEVLRDPAPAATESLGATIAVGPGLLQSVRGLGGGFGASLRAGITRGPWSASLWLLPSLARSVRTPEGTADLRDDLIGGELAWRWRVSPVIQPDLALGAGAYHLRVAGREVSPLAPVTSTLWTSFVSAGAGVAFLLGARWAVQADLRAAFTRRAAAVRVGGSEAGRTGWPVLAATVAVARAW